MAGKSDKRGLGRGLSALMADVVLENGGSDGNASEKRLPVEHLFPNPDQPRRSFTDEDLKNLAASIREKGVIQPLIVRKIADKTDAYEIVAGERRWRAAQMAQLHDVPVVVREFSDAEVLEVAIIENVQREDLNPLEEARGYRALMDRFDRTQEELAKGLSKSRSHIANMLRLLNLPEGVLEFMRRGDLSAGHARALVGHENAMELARQVVSRGLSVRATEALTRNSTGKTTKAAVTASPKDADTRALEGELSANTGMKVSIDHLSGSEKGKITISYSSMLDLDRLCNLLSQG